MSDDLDIELHGEAAGEVPVAAPGEFVVVVASAILDRMDAHVAEDTSVEHGGMMVGHVDSATGATVIVGSIRALGSISEAANLTFTHETWDHVGQVMDEQYPDEQIVGWYHSHPHFGIFLSEHDQFIQRNFFAQPWQVAYVRDPLLDQRGFFGWADGSIIDIENWEVADLPVVGEAARLMRPTADASADTGQAQQLPPPPRPQATVHRSRWKVLLVVVLMVAIAGVIAFARGVGDDGEDQEATLELPGGNVAGPPGDVLVVGDARVTGADGRLARLEPVIAVAQLGGEAIRVETVRRPGPAWTLTVPVPEDARPGLYDVRVVVNLCDDDPCTPEAAVDTVERGFQVEVLAPEASEAPEVPEADATGGGSVDP